MENRRFCRICGSEKDVEESHDIPKYMGGTDSMGRHLLCSECHDVYERRILRVCFEALFKERINLSDKDRRTLIPHQTKIKNSTIVRKMACRDIAKQIKEEYFNGDSKTITT